MIKLLSLNAEVLPERAALSVLPDPLLGRSTDAPPPGSPPPAPPAPQPPPAVNGENGSSVYYSCQTTYNYGSQGVLRTVGLGPTPTASTSCMPAVTTTR